MHNAQWTDKALQRYKKEQEGLHSERLEGSEGRWRWSVLYHCKTDWKLLYWKWSVELCQPTRRSKGSWGRGAKKPSQRKWLWNGSFRSAVTGVYLLVWGPHPWNWRTCCLGGVRRMYWKKSLELSAQATEFTQTQLRSWLCSQLEAEAWAIHSISLSFRKGIVSPASQSCCKDNWW